MADCSNIITKIYLHPDFNQVIDKVHPEHIRNDVRQEVAIRLLQQPCDKLAALFAQDNLLRYSIRIIWKLIYEGHYPLSEKFCRKELEKAFSYISLTDDAGAIPLNIADQAKQYLQRQKEDIYEDHESIIFNKYTELGSSRKVAKYYNIPLNHVCNVVSKVKKELKCLLLQ
jgi:hypothetical protein